jgi:hypothetical protein
LAASHYVPSKSFRSLTDFRPFKQVADQIKSDILKELSTLRLDDDQRVAFYPLGAGEGLLLDRTTALWQRRYFKDKFYVDKYFDVTE